MRIIRYKKDEQTKKGILKKDKIYEIKGDLFADFLLVKK